MFLRRIGAALLSLTIASAALAAAPAGAAEDPVLGDQLFFDDFAGGMTGWRALTGALSEWQPAGAEFSYTTVDTRTQPSGRYIVPTAPLQLPASYQLRTRFRLEAVSTSPALNVLTDFREPLAVNQNNLTAQVTGQGAIGIARPNTQTVCRGRGPVELNEWHDLVIRRANGISVVEIDGQRVAAVASPAAGGTVGLGVYHAHASFASVVVHDLVQPPDDHPTTATGCDWTEPGTPDVDQPVLLNQSGYDVALPKRFTAPRAVDGDAFTVVDAAGTVRHSGTVLGGVGDFSSFRPADTGPFTVKVTGAAGDGESVPFAIGASLLERVTYQRAVNFMTDVRCYYGRFDLMVHGGTDTQNCSLGVGWRDSHQLSFELPALVDLYLSNPSAWQRITDPSATYQGLPVQLPADTPELVRLIHWAVEVYLDARVNHTLLKEQLASFLYAYPYLEQYIPRSVYERARDYLFGIWGNPAKDRFAWYDYTPHTADLFQVYTQVGTGKGEFPPGHSVWPNLMMYDVAQREGRPDAGRYLKAAQDQAAWLVTNLDPATPEVTKGQRQGEHHLVTGLVRFAQRYPTAAPAGIRDFVRDWAEVVTERSANLWDFRKYSADRWTIPSFAGGGSAEDPNETGNVAGFAAPALAAAGLLGADPLAARLREIAVAHVDNIFGRNPTGRHASFRGATAQWGFEGVDLGWFSEYQGGAGRLQGARGVLDGSPKNAHYPYNPQLGNVGHTEGWVTFNSAWNEALSWLAADRTSVSLPATIPAGGTLTLELRAPLNFDTAALDTATVQLTVGNATWNVTVRQVIENEDVYRATVDLDAVAGDRVRVGYGFGHYERSAETLVVPGCDGRAATVTGTAGRDVLTGTAGPDVITGLGGDDVITGKGGDDVLCGDAGNDVVTGNDGDDRIDGGTGNDVVTGNDGDDTLYGGPGDDVVNGNDGDDEVYGGPGTDLVNGNDGRDLVVQDD
jgi:hemolysin type calcium-binding protein